MFRKPNLNDVVNKEIHNATKGINKDEQLQSYIHPDINFKRNSINLLIGRRGCGKTFNTVREVIKVSKLPGHGGYTSFVIVSDKPNDSTINELLKLINLKVIQTDYANAMNCLNGIIDGKAAYDQVIRKYLANNLTDDSKEDILSRVMDDNFYDSLPHTLILLDDAINVLKQKRHQGLEDLLFRNRQPRFTIFICAQDPFGIPVKIRRNLDSLWFFGGFKDKLLFYRILNQFYPEGQSKKELMFARYCELGNNDIMIFDYNEDGTNVIIVEN
jgi:hypothetical protein